MTSDTRDERPAMLPGEVRESNATNPNYRPAANLQADEALGPADNEVTMISTRDVIVTVPTAKTKSSRWTDNVLIIFLVVSMALGIVVGFCLRLRPEPYTSSEVRHIGFPGELLLNMLKLTIIPLIMSSLIVGLTSMDNRVSKNMCFRAAVYYLSTTFIAVILGISLVVVIQPGEPIKHKSTHDNDTDEGAKKVNADALNTFLNLIRNLFPDNVVEMTFRKKVPKYVEKNKNETQFKVVKVEGTNMLGVVSFSIALAIAINCLEENVGRPLKQLFQSLSEASILLVRAAIWYSPVGVFFLIVQEIVKMVDPYETFSEVAFYTLTVAVGLVLHGYGILPLIYWVFVRKNPLTFVRGMLPAIMTALATASSLATLPVTMKYLRDMGVDHRIVDFVAPVGANINMDGTALYEAVAVIFIGQTLGKSFTFASILTISITATAAAIGAAGVPQAGLVTMVIVLTAVGYPTDKVVLILAVDWLLDRFRTSINVLGDAYGAAIVYRLSRADLQRIDAAEARRHRVTISREQTISSSSQTTTQLPLLSHKEPVLNPPERPPESPTGSPPESPTGSPPESSYEKRLSTALS